MGCTHGSRKKDTQKYVDKKVHVEHKIGTHLSVCKAEKKIGFDIDCTGKITTDRDEIYTDHVGNKIPPILDVVENRRRKTH